MAKKIIIEGNAITVIDTSDGKRLLSEPVKSIWYSETMLQSDVVQLTNIDPEDTKHLVSFSLSDCLDSSGANFTANSFRTFCQNNLGKYSASNGGGGGGAVLLEVENSSGQDFDKGSVVYITDQVPYSGKPNVALANAVNEDKMYAVGVTNEYISYGDTGFVIVRGLLEGLDTSSWSAGDNLYVLASEDQEKVFADRMEGYGGGVESSDCSYLHYINGLGEMTNTAPVGDELVQNIGIVTISDSIDGSVLVLNRI